MKRYWCRIGIVLIVLGLAGCNLSRDELPQKVTATLSTPVAWATATTPTSAATLPSLTPAPTLTSNAIPPTSSDMGIIAPPTFTPSGQVIFPTWTVLPTLTPTTGAAAVAPTATNTPLGIITATFTAAPTSTNTPTGGITGTAMWGAYPAPSSFTPVTHQPTQVAMLTGAQVCSTCSNLRLRDAPGTAGNVVAYLAADTPLSVIGRTGDNQWVQVVIADGRSGWVAAQYLSLNIDLNVLSVTGTANDLPTAPAVAGLSSIEVVSGVSSHSREIFLDGLAKGNLPHVFTRVGDSITASPYFLVPIGQGNYRLGEYSYMSGVISFFRGPNGRGLNPFAASSMAARNGWGTTSILDPANADPNLCRAGETPLECEYRVVKPAVALIMIGTNDSGGLDAPTYRANLEAIVQISINMGVIPVLSTVPPKHYDPRTDHRAAEFNQIIVATARAYDIPLWNYWLVMSRTPGEGLDPDGVHPSIPPDGATGIFDATHLQYGYTVRNLTALQVLYTLWQQVLYDADTARPATKVPTSGDPGTDPTYSCPGAPAPRLTVGLSGRVTPGYPNALRNAPSLSAERIGNIPGEGVFTVLAGPRCADGFSWWQVNYNGSVGWTAEGDSSEYWVEPY